MEMDEYDAPVVDLLPDGSIRIHSVELGEVTIETSAHGRVSIMVEEKAREAYRMANERAKSKRLQSQLDELESPLDIYLATKRALLINEEGECE